MRSEDYLKQKFDRIKIGSQYVGQGIPTFFIAEIGINHNGHLETAKELIKNAKMSGANAVKFQKRNIEKIFTKKMLSEPYESVNSYGKTYGEHRLNLEFSREDYVELMNCAAELDILFFASVWDESSVDFMMDLNVDAFKIASADATNLRLIDKVAQTGKPILVSTGMSTEKEIQEIVRFVQARTSKYIFFHSTSLYPAKYTDVNLKFIDRLREITGENPIGYSGHEVDILPSLVSVVKGVSVIERHLTLDKSGKGSDHSASLIPSEFSDLVKQTRSIEQILGEGSKDSLSSQLILMKRKLGKSLYYASDLSSGHRLKKENLMLLSPGDGITPIEELSIVGKRLARNVVAEQQVMLEDFNG